MSIESVKINELEGEIRTLKVHVLLDHFFIVAMAIALILLFSNGWGG